MREAARPKAMRPMSDRNAMGYLLGMKELVMGKKGLPVWAVKPHDDVEPGVEVRLNDDGTIDEICLMQPATFHLEQMDDGIYWIGLNWRDADGNDRMQHVTLSTVRSAPIYPTVYT